MTITIEKKDLFAMPQGYYLAHCISGDYALGFEPCTCELDDGFCYKVIKAKEQIAFFVNISVE